MGAVSGNGGYIKNVAARFDVGKWTLSKDPRLVEVTTSATTGTRYKGVITDPSGTVELPWDSSATPETAGFVEGATIASLMLKMGAGTVYYTVANTSIGPVEVETDNKGDVVRIRFSFKGGDVSGPA